MSAARLFLCFDSDRDDDLRKLFTRQFLPPGSGLRVVDWSKEENPHSGWEGELRTRLGDVDVVVVLCSERTHDSVNVGREFGIAKEQEKPYVLLWGRRGSMCKKPHGARSDEGMYMWTPGSLEHRLAYGLRGSHEPA